MLLLESMEMEKLVSEGQNQLVEHFQALLKNRSWILGSVGVNKELVKDWSTKFHSNLLVLQPHVSTNLDFKGYLIDKLTVSWNLLLIIHCFEDVPLKRIIANSLGLTNIYRVFCRTPS